MQLRAYSLDAARLYFERDTGTYVRLRGPAYQSERRRAPRVVQIGLTNRCNLRCSFCFRERTLPSRWTADELIEWAARLAEFGVLELGFGQGEPLLFPEFPALVRTLSRTTPLAINFTTNGLRLDDARLDEFDDAFGQLRLSYYHDNDPLTRTRMLARRRARFGVNLLVTPQRIDRLTTIVDELVDAGCRDVLLLPYNGPDRTLHLAPADDRRMAHSVIELHDRHGDALALRLGVCLGRRLSEVPQLRLSDDCGAGDDFVTIDSDKRMLPCSFHASAVPVDSPDAMLELWQARRRLRTHAGLDGCARPRLRLAPTDSVSEPPQVVMWQGFASNHSSSYTLVGEFSTAAKSAAYVERIEGLLEQCRAASNRTSGRPDTLWQLLGHAGQPRDEMYLTSPSTLAGCWPKTILAGGRRVLVHDHSTLHTHSFFAHQLLRGHGRILFHSNFWQRELDLVFGIEAGDARAELEARLARGCDSIHGEGTRVYGIVRAYAIESVAPLLRELPHAIACIHDTDEDLASALAARPPAQSRKRRVEWTLLQWTSPTTWRRQLTELQADPAGYLAEQHWPHPFRMPERLDAHALLGNTIVRSEGAPFPGALQAAVFGERCQIVSAPRMRLRVGRWTNRDNPEQTFEGLRPEHIAGLSRPGGAYALNHRFGQSSIDILPRNPAATFAQLDAILGKLGSIEVDIMPERPLAHALGEIDADLDAAARAAADS